MKIDKLNQISTKKGDKGTSRNYSNIPFMKNDILFETLGTMDELSSFLGLTYHHTKYENIIHIQQNLQKINSIIATVPGTENYERIAKMDTDEVKWIETEMQLVLDKKPLEPRFTLPGSEKSLPGAYFDVARTLARKAERRLVDFSIKHSRNDLEIVMQYVNRLSDFLFVLSCNFE